MARVALDAMGSDHGPAELVAGAARAAEDGHELVLVGDEPTLRSMVADCGVDLPIVHASQVIDMAEDPAKAIREKADASVVKTAKMVRTGEVEAMVSAGSTGAVLAAAVILIGRLAGVHRPAIATVIPTAGSPTVMIDSGANPECRPEYLVQFAVMGSLLSEVILGVSVPRVALFNIGVEKSKGRDLDREVYARLVDAPLNFIGNVEGRDILNDSADVWVTDGFTGNVVLKTTEATAHYALSLALAALGQLPDHMQGAVMGALESIQQTLNPDEYGGAHLVGTKGVVIIAHGASSSTAIYNAIRMATEGAKGGFVEQLETRLAAI